MTTLVTTMNTDCDCGAVEAADVLLKLMTSNSAAVDAAVALTMVMTMTIAMIMILMTMTMRIA